MLEKLLHQQRSCMFFNCLVISLYASCSCDDSIDKILSFCNQRIRMERLKKSLDDPQSE
jgi:hypothetical protein